MADSSGDVISLSQEGTHPSSVTTSNRGSGGGGGDVNSNAFNHQSPTHSASKNSTGKQTGRPPESKNKSKPSTTVVSKNKDSTMTTLVLEISAGSDVIGSIISFAREKKICIALITATGSVSMATIRQPNLHAPPVTVLGLFSLLSLSGLYIEALGHQQQQPQPSSSSSSSTITSSPPRPASSDPLPPLCCSFTVAFTGTQGHVLGGIVKGKVMAATKVIVIAASFVRPSVHRLPCSSNDNNNNDQDSGPSSGRVNDNAGGGGPAAIGSGGGGPATIGGGGGVTFIESPNSHSSD